MSVTRRMLLASGALALAGASTARAATDERTILLGLWRREMNANLAYTQVEHVDRVFVPLRRHEFEHGQALATELAAVGLGTPARPKELDDLDSTSERLARARGRDEVVAAAVALEDELIALYQHSLAGLSDPKIAMTVATILASHAQHRVALGADALAGAR